MNTEEKNQINKAITNAFVSPNEEDTNGEAANVVDGLFALARSISVGLKYLGNGDAYTGGKGALECVGSAMLESAEKIASPLHGIAEALSEVAREIRLLRESE